MNRRKVKWITWVIMLISISVVCVMLLSTLSRPVKITLPSSQADSDQSVTEDPEGNTLGLVEVSPHTVQAAIATLERPKNYRRSISVEQFWSGGSGAYEVTVIAAEAWVRTARTMADGRVRHTITGEETVYIWYNNEQTIYTGPAGEISADNEQTIPTYEDILALPPEAIAAADHRVISETSCIYVETNADDYGYVYRYWVSLDTGLLAAAEKLQDGKTVYRMAGLTVEQTEAMPGEFILPDGTELLVI